jgi:hypothetical protein
MDDPHREVEVLAVVRRKLGDDVGGMSGSDRTVADFEVY